MFKKSSDGVDFTVKKIVNDMAVLESQDRRRQLLTEAKGRVSKMDGDK